MSVTNDQIPAGCLPLVSKIEEKFGKLNESIFLYGITSFNFRGTRSYCLIVTDYKIHRMKFVDEWILVYNPATEEFWFKGEYYTIDQFQKVLRLLAFI